MLTKWTQKMKSIKRQNEQMPPDVAIADAMANGQIQEGIDTQRKALFGQEDTMADQQMGQNTPVSASVVGWDWPMLGIHVNCSKLSTRPQMYKASTMNILCVKWLG
jgi:hypothetical protein